MKYCVATYGYSCLRGKVAIYSMTITDKAESRRLLTIELDVPNRRIVQACGRFNAPSTAIDRRILNAWATTAGLTIAKFAL
jgi:hypothetical protein